MGYPHTGTKLSVRPSIHSRCHAAVRIEFGRFPSIKSPFQLDVSSRSQNTIYCILWPFTSYIDIYPSHVSNSVGVFYISRPTTNRRADVASHSRSESSTAKWPSSTLSPRWLRKGRRLYPCPPLTVDLAFLDFSPMTWCLPLQSVPIHNIGCDATTHIAIGIAVSSFSPVATHLRLLSLLSVAAFIPCLTLPLALHSQNQAFV